MNLDEIRTITIRTLTEGVDKAVSDLNKLTDAQAGLTIESDKSSKASTSVKNALDGQQRTLDTAYRAQNQFNKSQLDITRGYNEGMVSLDRYNQLSALNTQRLKDATTSHSLLEKAMSGVQGQLVALAGGAGPVGVFLAGLGPWGLAAAAGLGAAKDVFMVLVNAAAEVGAKAQALQAFSLVTGLATDQIQKLEEAGAKFGLSTENVSRFVDQFSVKLDEARKASGTYYNIVRAINPALAEQILTTKGEAAQLQILAAAYAQAGEKANALLQAASGRGGVVNAPLIGALGAVGGDVNNLPGKPPLSPSEIKLMADTTSEMNASWERIKTNIGSILWSPETATQGLEIRHDVEGITAAIREFNPSAAWTTFTQWVDRTSGGWLGNVLGRGAPPPMTAPVIPVFSHGSLPDATPPVVDAQATANTYKEIVTALGSAASATQHLVEKQLTLYAQFKSGAIDADTYNKAVRGALTENLTQSINATVGSLGMMATSTDIATQSQLRINKAVLDGGRINKDQSDLIVQADQLKFAATKQNTAAQFGLVSETEILDQKNKEYINITKQLGLGQTAEGFTLVARNARAYSDSIKVATSAFPGLTQMTLDFTNSNKMIDQFGVSTMNNLSTAMVDVVSHTKSFGQSFTDLAQIVVKSAEKMVIELMILGPLMRALGFAGSGAMADAGVGSGVGTGGFNFMDAQAGPPVGSATGAVFSGPGIGSFSSSIITRPTLFPMASGMGLMGEAGPEAVMPLKRGSDGRLGVAGGGGNVEALALGPTVLPGSVSHEPTSHYGLLRTIEQAWGLPLLGRSARARPITGIWR